MKMRTWFLAIVILCVITQSYGQKISDDNFIFWSSARKFTVNDFLIKTKDLETSPSFAQFSVDYQVGGFDFLTKNFNKKVHNYMIKSASWIDTTYEVAASLKYQQTLFDICEIYTRKFRKELKENRKKIASGTQFIKDLNSKAMTEFQNRHVAYDRETKFGTIADKQKEWEVQIQNELGELKNFAYE